MRMTKEPFSETFARASKVYQKISVWDIKGLLQPDKQIDMIRMR